MWIFYACCFALIDAPAPTWEQLAKGLEAVRTVVHGLVDFIQNHSKKGGDQQQVGNQITNIKYELLDILIFNTY